MTTKSQAKAFFTAMNDCNEDQIRALAREDYIQHNPAVPTGRKALIDLMHLLRSQNSKIRNHLILTQGSFAVMLHKWSNSSSFAPGGASSVWGCHLIRLDSIDRVAEHWCCMCASLNPEPMKAIPHGDMRSHFSLHEGTQKFEIHEKREGSLISSVFEFEGIQVPGLPENFFLQQKLPDRPPLNSNGVFNFPTH